MSNMCSSRDSRRRTERYLVVKNWVSERADRQWCLFLDRDGVVNRRIAGDYARTWGDFEWLPGALEALVTLREWAPQLVVVTNQQGVGKGLMRAEDVSEIHRRLQADLSDAGALVDGFQVCPHLEAVGCSCRKPKPNLVLDWLRQHPESEPSLSIMVGDSRSDIELAQNVGVSTGRCVSIHIGSPKLGAAAHASFDSLWEFAVMVADAREELG